MNPIWQDYSVDLFDVNEAEYVDYTIGIRQSGAWAVIYTGRAYKTPDDMNDVRINDICADYLSHVPLPDVLASNYSNGIVDLKCSGNFRIDAFNSDGESEAVSQVVFFNCWDYKTQTLGINEKLSGTISREYVAAMPVVMTNVGKMSLTSPLPQVTHFKRVDSKYTLVECCNPAALYFWNAKCGWDFLLCKGGAKRIDSFVRNTIKRDYNNDGNGRGTYNYRNVAQIAWDVATGWIPAAGCKELWQLLGSTDVWLWTPDDGLVPVVVDTDSVEEKDYVQNGRKPVELTIRVNLAQDRQRR